MDPVTIVVVIIMGINVLLFIAAIITIATHNK